MFKKGFTLVEFMIALAIIAILAGAIIVGLSSTKKEAKNDTSLLAANEAIDKVLDCMEKGSNVNLNNPAANAVVCAGSELPNLPTGWVWGTITGVVATKLYNINITATGKTIRCTNQTGLTINGQQTTADGRCITTGF